MNIVTNRFKTFLKQKKCTIIYSFFCILLFCEFLMYFSVFATYVFHCFFISYYSNIN